MKTISANDIGRIMGFVWCIRVLRLIRKETYDQVDQESYEIWTTGYGHDP